MSRIVLAKPQPAGCRNMTDAEIARAAYFAFPSPGPLLAEVLRRFDQHVAGRLASDPLVSTPKAENALHCPACGVQVRIEPVAKHGDDFPDDYEV